MENSLFTEYGAWTEDAQELAAAAHVKLKPLIQAFLDKGYSMREIAHILVHEITGTECEIVLRRAVELRKKTTFKLRRHYEEEKIN